MPATSRSSSRKTPRTAKPARRTALDFDVVREIGSTLPEVEESTAYGTFALKVRKKLFACTAINKQAEPNSLLIRLGFKDRDRLIEEHPDVYYLKDHYAGYPCVLVRLSRIRRAALREVLGEAWRYVIEMTPEKRPRKKRA